MRRSELDKLRLGSAGFPTQSRVVRVEDWPAAFRTRVSSACKWACAWEAR